MLHNTDLARTHVCGLGSLCPARREEKTSPGHGLLHHVLCSVLQEMKREACAFSEAWLFRLALVARGASPAQVPSVCASRGLAELSHCMGLIRSDGVL